MTKQRLMNDGWLFAKQPLGTAPNQAARADWQAVDIPHDWLIVDPLNLYETGEGWYRKQISGDHSEGCRVALRFEGVYMECTFYVNGEMAGEWKYGYTTFEIDVTDHLRPGENELLVRVVYRSPNTRWYSGAGIYRSVWRKEIPPTHLVADGVYATPRAGAQGWEVAISAEVEAGEHERLRLVHRLLDAQGAEAASVACEAQGSGNPRAMMRVASPALWSLDSPNCYTLETWLLDASGAVLDESATTLGFRTTRFDSEHGFFLNGEHVKLCGVCEHHDLGALGSAMNRVALQRKFDLLRSMGVNAIRTGHSVPAVELMDIADRSGMLILSDAFDIWEKSKTQFDYARFFPEWVERDVAAWVRRDRNHPSLIMWSIGNEIPDTHIDERGQYWTRTLQELVRRHDPENHAPVTIGSNYMPWENAQKCADILKYPGYNYAEKYYSEHHAAHPDWVIYGSETASVVQSRGIYHFPLSVSILADDDGQCSALGNSPVSWGARSIEGCITDDRDATFSLGQFIWTGFDYIGEPTPYHSKNSFFGQIDTAGFPKDGYYMFRAEWAGSRVAPFVHLFPYWDFNPGQRIDVRACTNAASVQLFVDGVPQGRVEIDHERGHRLLGDWQIPYAPGVLRAEAYDEQGNVVATDERRSFGEAASIDLAADRSELRADGLDMAFLTVTVRDEAGNPVENARNRMEVEVRGAARLVGLDNGDSTDYEPYTGSSRRLFSGKLLIMLAACTEPGDIEVTVSSAGLPDRSIGLRALSAPVPAGISATRRNTVSPRNDSHPDIPVRKVELHSAVTRLDPSTLQTEVEARLLPAHCTDREVIWRVTNAAGIDTNLAAVEAHGLRATVRALGDGRFYLRCLSKCGTDHVCIISQLEFEAVGIGCPTLDPYQPVCGGLYSLSEGQIGNGNERGASTARDGRSMLGYQGLDFGAAGSDELTMSIFCLDSDPTPIEIWEGAPDTPGASLLAEVIYHKPCIWNEYQLETFRLSRRMRGQKALCFVVHKKIHIKEFVFARQSSAYRRNTGADRDAIYGDAFTESGADVLGIGNNVTLRYDGLDFGAPPALGIALEGRARNAKNPVQLRFEGESGEQVRLIEFAGSEDFTRQRFDIEPFQGYGTLSFVFLPGSDFDFRAFTFEAGE